MAASEELARRVAGAGRSCSPTTAVLEEWPRPGTPRRVEYLAGRLEAERSSREASRCAAPLGRCALPALKTFDGHDWSAASWPEGMGRESLPALMGDVGTGKTRVASALCAPSTTGGRAHRQDSPARHRRARVSPTRHGRGEAALPGLRRRRRDAVGGDYREPGVQQVGVGVRGRPDGRRRDRPHRPPREARPVPWRVLPRPPCPHAGGLAAQERARFRCSGCPISDALFAQILLTKHTSMVPSDMWCL